MVQRESSHYLDGGTLFESCLPSDTRGSGSGLHTINWIEISNRKISLKFLVLWYNDRILPLQQILCVRKLRNRNLLGKLHYSLSNNTTMLHHILFSLPQVRNLGMTIKLDPQGDKITCPAF